MKSKQITFHKEDGSTYQGTWKDGKEHGYGVGKGDGCTYEGGWKNGLPHGEGTLIDDEGSVFEGDFVDGIPTEGIIEFDDGSMYGGALNDQGVDGTGFIIGVDGERMNGTWVNNEMHGVFEISDEEGYYGIGEYKHDKRHAVWYEEEPDGSKWDVKYEDGEVVWSDERKIELVPDK